MHPLKQKTRIESTGSDTIRIKPGEDISLSKIKRALQLNRLDPVVSWHSRELYLPAAVFARTCEALEGIDFDVAPALATAQNNAQKDEAFLKRAKQLIHELAQPGKAEAALADLPGLNVLDPHQVVAVAIATHPDM